MPFAAERAGIVGINRERELLRGRIVLVRVVEEPVVAARVAAVADTLQVPARKDPRAGIHVTFGVVADTHREELHDLAREVLLRAEAHVRVLVEPHDHGGISRNLDQKVAEVAERVVAEELQLAPNLPGVLRRFRGHHPRAVDGVRVASNLAVGGSEMVVPEERHLLLQRPAAVHHPEKPALAGIVDDRGRRKRPVRRRLDVARRADLPIDIVCNGGVVEKLVDRLGQAAAAVVLEFSGCRAKSRPPQQMLNLWIVRSHDATLDWGDGYYVTFNVWLEIQAIFPVK
jgi:hypothetical protein